ncbi:unnamed protein product [Prunus armeniaca]
MASIGSFDPSDPTVGPSLLAFGADGNLLLADADGRVARQTNTANKNVVGFKLLPNGDLVLHCSKGNFVWQSFDYPTDTLLAGQALRAGLVIWASEKDNSNGLYILVLDNVALSFQPTSELDEAHAFSISLKQTRMSSLIGPESLARPKHNSTVSFLRLGFDGNLRVYTCRSNVGNLGFVRTTNVLLAHCPMD